MTDRLFPPGQRHQVKFQTRPAPTAAAFTAFRSMRSAIGSVSMPKALPSVMVTPAGAGRDVFIDTSVPDEIYIRYEARNQAGGGQTIRYAILLRADGTIRFDYGEGNTNGTRTVGISYGNNYDHHIIEGYHGSGDLSGAPSVLIQLAPGIVDIGAYEFKGNSLDNIPPLTVGTHPAEIDSQGTVFAFLDEITVIFSEAIDSIDARSIATYELIRDLDGDGQFTSADQFSTLIPIYDPATNSVRLAVDGGVLPDGLYRFRIQSANLRDVSGNRLDGDNSGSAGGDYIRVFNLVQPVLPEFTSPLEVEAVRGVAFIYQIEATESPNAFGAAGLPAGLSINSSTGLISGTPTEAGIFNVILAATNTDGTSEATLELLVRAAPQISAVVINGGAEQRSMLWEIEIFFDGNVSAGLSAGAFRLFNQTTNTLVDPEAVQMSWSFLSLSATLTFPIMTGGSLPDGQYLLTIASDAVSDEFELNLDGNEDGAPGGDYAVQFHRLFGDTTGNGSVDTLDGLRLRSARFTSAGDDNFRPELDSTGNGTIDETDVALFQANFRTGFDLNPPAPLVTEVRVNSGEAQRSVVTEVEIFLTGDVGASAGEGSVRVFNQTTGEWVPGSAISTSWNFASRSILLTFGGLPGGSLADGVYGLVIYDGALSDASGAALDGNRDGTPGGMFHQVFHRLFGDSTGTGSVDSLDALRFREAYGASEEDENYLAYFDIDQSGEIDETDRAAFLANLRRVLDFVNLVPIPSDPD